MGFTDSAIAARLRSGRWQRLHAGVYATFSGDPLRQAWLWAAVLRAGRAAVLSHQTAAAARLPGRGSVVNAARLPDWA